MTTGFQRIHRREDGVALDFFRNCKSYARRAEGYKEALAMEAGRILPWRR